MDIGEVVLDVAHEREKNYTKLRISFSGIFTRWEQPNRVQQAQEQIV